MTVLVCVAGVVALAGTVVHFAMRTDHSAAGEGQSRPLQPYLYLSSGAVMLVSGSFLLRFTIIPASINILAGALFTIAGASSIRRHPDTTTSSARQD
jgi:hypothetical protein